MSISTSGSGITLSAAQGSGQGTSYNNIQALGNSFSMNLAGDLSNSGTIASRKAMTLNVESIQTIKHAFALGAPPSLGA